jgi:hypothetical protein
MMKDKEQSTTTEVGPPLPHHHVRGISHRLPLIQLYANGWLVSTAGRKKYLFLLQANEDGTGETGQSPVKKGTHFGEG